MSGDAGVDDVLPLPLTASAGRGCADARFEDWYRDHYDRLRGLCARILSDASAAEDIAQETLLRAWLGRERMREQDVGAWLSVVARNLCVSHMRKRWRAVPHDILPDGPDHEADPAFEAERSETRRSVRRALSQVGERHRRLLVRREVGGADYAELGEELGLTASGARAVLFRARRSLKDRLAAAGEGLGAWIAGFKIRLGSATNRARGSLQHVETAGVNALQAGMSLAIAAGIALSSNMAPPVTTDELASALRSSAPGRGPAIVAGSEGLPTTHEQSVSERGAGREGTAGSPALRSRFDPDEGTTFTVDPPGSAPPRDIKQYEKDGKNPYSITDIWLDEVERIHCAVNPTCN